MCPIFEFVGVDLLDGLRRPEQGFPRFFTSTALRRKSDHHLRILPGFREALEWQPGSIGPYSTSTNQDGALDAFVL